MAKEVEIKLRVPARALRGVSRLPWLREMTNGRIRRTKLVSVYYDTGKFKLRQHGIALRVRRSGGKWLQTVKSDAGGAAGAFARHEWEREVKGGKPDLDGAGDTALEPLISASLARKLKPAFETAIWRTAIPIRSGDSDLELAIDRGRIRAGRRQENVSEIEIELKSGDPAEISRVAERIAKSLPVAFECRTKPERGYALRAGLKGKAVHAAEVALPPEVTTGEAFRIIGLACLRHLAANEQAVRKGDAEGVHQMRVGLRRLRAAISVFRELVEDAETEAIKTELKWLTEQLAPARDFDVFVRESVAPLSEARPGSSEIEVLRQDMEARRDAGFARAKKAVDSDRYRRIVLEVALWLADGGWSTSTDEPRAARRERPVAGFATEALTALTAKILKKARKLKKLDVLQRHKLRIAIKKLRYATEFFASLYAGTKVRARQKRLADTLEELQEALGQLNDIVMHQKLAGEIVQHGKHPDQRPEKAFAMGMVAGREQAKYDASIAQATKAGGRLTARRQFWQ